MTSDEAIAHYCRAWAAYFYADTAGARQDARHWYQKAHRRLFELSKVPYPLDVENAADAQYGADMAKQDEEYSKTCEREIKPLRGRTR